MRGRGCSLADSHGTQKKHGGCGGKLSKPPAKFSGSMESFAFWATATGGICSTNRHAVQTLRVSGRFPAHGPGRDMFPAAFPDTTPLCSLHPGRLTWNLKNQWVVKENPSFRGPLLRCNVSIFHAWSVSMHRSCLEFLGR